MLTDITPGPWHVSGLTKAWGVYDPSGTLIARVGGAYGVAAERREADARAIAAVPHLVAALRFMLAYVPEAAKQPVYEQAREALALAEGRLYHQQPDKLTWPKPHPGYRS